VLAEAAAAAVFAVAPLPLVLIDAAAATVFALAPPPLVLAEATAAAVFALAPPPLVLAEADATAVFAPAPLPLVFAKVSPVVNTPLFFFFPLSRRCQLRCGAGEVRLGLWSRGRRLRCGAGVVNERQFAMVLLAGYALYQLGTLPVSGHGRRHCASRPSPAWYKSRTSGSISLSLPQALLMSYWTRTPRCTVTIMMMARMRGCPAIPSSTAHKMSYLASTPRCTATIKILAIPLASPLPIT